MATGNVRLRCAASFVGVTGGFYKFEFKFNAFADVITPAVTVVVHGKMVVAWLQIRAFASRETLSEALPGLFLVASEVAQALRVQFENGDKFNMLQHIPQCSSFEQLVKLASDRELWKAHRPTRRLCHTRKAKATLTPNPSTYPLRSPE